MTAVTGILLFILLSGRFVKYLAQVAEGELGADVLLLIMAYRVPGFLELLLPLGLFLGILLGFGRMYLESEMVVLQASGVGQTTLIKYVMGPALLVMALVAGVSLWLAPWSAEQSRIIYEQQKARSELDTVMVGRFQRYEGVQEKVTYVESLTADGKLAEVFVFQSSEKGPFVLRAQTGHRELDEASQNAFFVLSQGESYLGTPGAFEFEVSDFDAYGFMIKDPVIREGIAKISAVPTSALIGADSAMEQAQLHWRLSLPVLALIVVLMAVPLSRVNPRQGRYAKLFPSIVLYLFYISMLSFVRSQSEEEALPAYALWGVHLLFLLLPINMIFAGRFWQSVFDQMPSLKIRRAS